MESPDERLTRTIADRAEAAAQRRRIDRAEEQVRRAEVTVGERRAALADEEKDVAKLEGLSWTRISSALRGQHATDLERESAERDAAQLAYREAEARHEQAKTELAAAQTRLDALGDTDAAYRAALASKEEWASTHDPALASRLTGLAERRGALEAELREVKEADDAGVEAYQALVAASGRLGSAEGWSTWDTFFGGGLITDAVKHSRIDDSRAELRRADHALQTFARELADLNQHAVATLDLSTGLQVFDVVFDNIFSDWMVLSRIGKAQEKVAETTSQVRRTVDRLRSRRTDLEKELADLAAEREQLLGS